MIASHSVTNVRPQQESCDNGAKFRALASVSASMLPRDSSVDRQISRARSNQSDREDVDQDITLQETNSECASDDTLLLSSSGTGGASVSSLLASLLVEASRQSGTVAEQWKLIVPLEQARFPDSAALIFTGPESIYVQFRSCDLLVLSMLEPIIEAVELMAHQSLGRRIQCSVCHIESPVGLYQ